MLFVFGTTAVNAVHLEEAYALDDPAYAGLAAASSELFVRSRSSWAAYSNAVLQLHRLRGSGQTSQARVDILRPLLLAALRVAEPTLPFSWNFGDRWGHSPERVLLGYPDVLARFLTLAGVADPTVLVYFVRGLESAAGIRLE